MGGGGQRKRPYNDRAADHRIDGLYFYIVTGKPGAGRIGGIDVCIARG